MKRLIVLSLAMLLTVFVFSNSDTTNGMQPGYKQVLIVDEATILKLKDSLEKDSLLQFSISNHFYSDYDQIELDSILLSLNNGVSPDFKNSMMVTGMTHYAWDESKKKIYDGGIYVAITTESDGFIKLTIFSGKLNSSSKSIIEDEIYYQQMLKETED